MAAPGEEILTTGDEGHPGSPDVIAKARRDWLGIFGIICGIAGILVGIVPVLGTPLRLCLSAVAAALGIGGAVECRKHGTAAKASVAATALGIVCIIWAGISMTVVAGVIGGAISWLFDQF